jgi:hypothetical protein
MNSSSSTTTERHREAKGLAERDGGGGCSPVGRRWCGSARMIVPALSTQVDVDGVALLSLECALATLPTRAGGGVD